MSLNLFDIRKELHRMPELAFQESRTKAFLLSILKGFQGIVIHEFNGNNGILAEYSQGSGEYLLFRADMDALPIREATGCDFSSQTEGMMHACGHDVHMAIMLGLIEQITVNQLQRNILFLFQPAEEGQGGAESVLVEQLIQSFNIKNAFALHVSGNLPVNTVSSKKSIFFAIPQEFNLVFSGTAAHAAFPEKGNNALKGGIIFSHRMSQYVDELGKTEQVIFNIGVMQSGTIRNIIPDKCLFQGTHRTLNKELRNLINEQIKATAEEIAQEYNLQYTLDYLCSYDPVVNDGELAELLKSICTDTGIEYRESRTYMTGEDFGFFTTLYPSLLFWLGAGTETADLHSDKFLPDERCIPVGIKVFSELINRIK